jgi:hypothetical protein
MKINGTPQDEPNPQELLQKWIDSPKLTDEEVLQLKEIEAGINKEFHE